MRLNQPVFQQFLEKYFGEKIDIFYLPKEEWSSHHTLTDIFGDDQVSIYRIGSNANKFSIAEFQDFSNWFNHLMAETNQDVFMDIAMEVNNNTPTWFMIIENDEDQLNDWIENNDDKLEEGGSIGSTDNKGLKVLLEENVNFDTRKGTNRSSEIVPDEVITEIEERGISVERLDELKLPIFKYKTQITVHGQFKDIGSGRVGVGGYKNLIKNQNQTLGIKYNGIDGDKKRIIAKAIRLARIDPEFEKNGFSVAYDSTGYRLTKSYLVANKEEFEAKKEELEALNKSIPNIFIGYKYISTGKIPFLGIIIQLVIVLNAIYEKDLWEFINIITNGIIPNKERFDELENDQLIKSQKEEVQRQLDKTQNFESWNKQLQEFQELHKDARIEEFPNSDKYILYSFSDSSRGKIAVYYIYKNKQNRLMYYVDHVNDLSEIDETINESSYSKASFIKIEQSLIRRINSDNLFLYKDLAPAESTKEPVRRNRPGEDEVLVENDAYKYYKSVHTSNGKDIWILKVKKQLGKKFQDFNSIVKSNGGYYSSFVKGFIFKKPIESLTRIDAFLDIKAPIVEIEQPSNETPIEEPVIENEVIEHHFDKDSFEAAATVADEPKKELWMFDSFGQFKRNLEPEYDETDKTLLHYSYNGQVVCHHKLGDANYTQLRECYYDIVQGALNSRKYKDAILDGKMTPKEVREIVEHAGFEVPNEYPYTQVEPEIPTESPYPQDHETTIDLLQKKLADIEAKEETQKEEDTSRAFIARKWENLPDAWKIVKKVPAKKFETIPSDKTLMSLFSDIIGKDDLRPVMSGVYFDKDRIVATDAHKLLVIPNNTPLDKSILVMHPSMKNLLKADVTDMKYPLYDSESIIPKEANVVCRVDVYKLKTFTQAILLGRFSNQTTYQIRLNYTNPETGKIHQIGFNAKFLDTILEMFLKLGHQIIFIGITTPNKAAIISNSENAAKYPNKNIGKFAIGLLMPILMDDDVSEPAEYDHDNIGAAQDYDFNREFAISYSLSRDEIIDSDGSIAKFDINLDRAIDSPLSDRELKILKQFIDKKSYIPILIDNVMVSNNKLYCTNLETELYIENVKLTDGLYNLLNDALVPAPYDPAEYPEPLLSRSEVQKRVAQIDRAEMIFHLEKAVLTVGKDQLRPIMSGVRLFSENENIIIEATDAHTLYRNVIGKSEIISEFDFVVDSPKKLLFGLANYECEYIDVVKLNDTNAIFNCSNIQMVLRIVEGRFPNVVAVFPTKYTKKVIFDRKFLEQALSKSPKPGKYETLILSFDPGKGIVDVGKGTGGDYELVETIDTKFPDNNIMEETIEPYNISDIYGFLLMPAIGKNDRLTFSKFILERLLEIVPLNEITLYGNENNRAFSVFNLGLVPVPKKQKVEKITREPVQKSDEIESDIMALKVLHEILESSKDKAIVSEEIENLKTRV